MQEDRHFFVRLARCLGCIESDNALYLTNAIASDAGVQIVLSLGCFTQVFPTVVQSVTVAVVNKERGPFTRHPKPNQAVGLVAAPMDSNCECAPVPFAGPSNLTSALTPSKYSCLWIVVQYPSHFFVRKIVERAEVWWQSAVNHFDAPSSLGPGTEQALARLPSRAFYQMAG